MKIKIIWIVLVIIICFLFIHMGYNNPVESLLSGLLWIVRKEGVALNLDNLPLQFLIVSGFLITAALLKKKMFVITGIIAMILLLRFWMYLLDFIEFDLFSIIPFMASSLLAIFFLVKAIRNERMERGENN